MARSIGGRVLMRVRMAWAVLVLVARTVAVVVALARWVGVGVAVVLGRGQPGRDAVVAVLAAAPP
ncbi:hypothetical protein J1C73_05485, partial [Streptomyces laculatispora]